MHYLNSYCWVVTSSTSLLYFPTFSPLVSSLHPSSQHRSNSENGSCADLEVTQAHHTFIVPLELASMMLDRGKLGMVSQLQP